MRWQFLVIILFFLSTQSFLFGRIDENKDFQIWIFESTSKKLSSKTSFVFEAEIRYGDAASQPYYYYFQPRVLFTLRDRLEISPGYRHGRSLRLSDREWRNTYSPQLDINLKGKLGEWTLLDRNRIVYNVHDDKRPNILEYRNRFSLVSPWVLGKMRFNPWISDEIFFRDREGFSQNRFIVGGSFPLHSRIKGNPCYIMRHRKRLDEVWTRQNVLALYMFFSF